MATVFADRIKVRSYSTGTAEFILESVVHGFRSFAAIGENNQCYYGIEDQAGNWEVGRGTYRVTGSQEFLYRDSVISSSNSNNLVDFPAGGKNVFNTLPSSLAAGIIGFELSVSADDSTQRLISSGETIKFIGSGNVTTSSDAEGNITITGSAASSAASALTGTTLASNVIASSLTSVGTLRTLSVSGAVTAEAVNTDQIIVVGNRIATTVTNANLEIECNGTGGVVINTVAPATTASTAASIGYLGLPQSATATTATLAIGDAGKHIYVTTTGQTITIPANSSVAYPVGTTLTFIAGPSATTVSIAIATDTMTLVGSTTTGTRTLAANGMASAVKVAATTWYINGTGLT
jgi:hypothetical protein